MIASCWRSICVAVSAQRERSLEVARSVWASRSEHRLLSVLMSALFTDMYASVWQVVDILVTQERINVCRPATAILKKLVVSGPNNAPTEQGGVVADGDGAASANGNGSNSVAAETASGPAKRANGELPGVYRFGFEGVYNHIQNQTAFLNTLVQRLSSADTTLCLYRYATLFTPT